MNNADPGNKWHLPNWWLFSLGFLVAVQMVQFFLIFMLYHYISTVEHRLSEEATQSKQEIIQMISGKQ